MAYFFPEPSHTFNEYLLVPGYSSAECIPAAVSLETPLVRYRKGEKSAITMKIPMIHRMISCTDMLFLPLIQNCYDSRVYGCITFQPCGIPCDHQYGVTFSRTYQICGDQFLPLRLHP